MNWQADGTREVSAQHSADDDAKQGGNDAPVEAWHELKSPVDFSKTVGRIRVQTQSATLMVSLRLRASNTPCSRRVSGCEPALCACRWNCRGDCMYGQHFMLMMCMPNVHCGLAQHLEKQFWGRALKIADLNADGTLELHEFSLLMKACLPTFSNFLMSGMSLVGHATNTAPACAHEHLYLRGSSAGRAARVRTTAWGDAHPHLVSRAASRIFIQAFGTELSKEEVEALYRRADTDNSNDVSEEELASYLVGAHKDGELSKVGFRVSAAGRA